MVLIANSRAKFFHIEGDIITPFQSSLSRLASFNLQRDLAMIYVYNESWHSAQHMNDQILSIFPSHSVT